MSLLIVVMARTSTGRAIVIRPASIMSNFLQVGYATTGVAIESLLNLSPIYPSPSLLGLANLRMNVSPRSERSSRAGSQAGSPPGSGSEDEADLAFHVVVFKKPINPKVPIGLDSASIAQFFGGLFQFANQDVRDDVEKTS